MVWLPKSSFFLAMTPSILATHQSICLMAKQPDEDAYGFGDSSIVSLSLASQETRYGADYPIPLLSRRWLGELPLASGDRISKQNATEAPFRAWRTVVFETTIRSSAGSSQPRQLLLQSLLSTRVPLDRSEHFVVHTLAGVCSTREKTSSWPTRRDAEAFCLGAR